MEQINESSAKSSISINQSKFVRLIDSHFNKSELASLCFDLEIDIENLPGETKWDKARELISFMQRQKRLEKLILKCQEIRPTVDWQAVNENHSQSNVHAQRKLSRNLMLVLLGLVIVVISILYFLNNLPQKCGTPIIEFMIKPEFKEGVLVLPNSTYEASPDESLLIEARINGRNPEEQEEYNCDWTYAGDGKETVEDKCKFVLRTGKDQVRDVVTVLLTKNTCTNSIVETLTIVSSQEKGAE